MKRLALCVYGVNPASTEFIRNVLARFSDYRITGFSSSHQERSVALLTSCYKKRAYEMETHTTFDVCLAIDTSAADLLPFTYIKDRLNNSFVYFVKGYFKGSNRSTGVSPLIFYANSLTFDRASEFKINLQYIETNWLREVTPEAVFFYHLASLNIRTECINYENSSLFIRST